MIASTSTISPSITTTTSLIPNVTNRSFLDLKNKFRLPKRPDASRPKKNLDHSIEKSTKIIKLGKVSNKPNPRKNEEKIKEAITKAFNDLKKLWYEKQLP